MIPIENTKKYKTAHAFQPKWVRYFVFIMTFVFSTAHGGQLIDRKFPSQNYPHSDNRKFYVYLPDSYNSNTALPMVMVLHGCNQTRDTVFDEFGWGEIADRFDVIIVAPDISTSDWFRSPKCWGYWEDKEIHQGKGEVEDLHQIGLQAEQEWNIDPNRRHIAGLSSGGFMANAAAVAHNEYWASAGVHSGGGYKESSATYSADCDTPRQASGTFHDPETIIADMQDEMDYDYTIPVMLIHSENDCSVGYGMKDDSSEWGGLTSNREAWLAINTGNLFATMDCSRDGIICTHQKFGYLSRSTVEVVSIVGLIQGTDKNKGHYWSGGSAPGQWTMTQGPRAATLFWDFFMRHPRNLCITCPARPTGLQTRFSGGQKLSLFWNANKESNVTGYYLYRNGIKLSADQISFTTYTDTNLQRNIVYTYNLTAINDIDQESHHSKNISVTILEDLACQSHFASLTEHTENGRAYAKEECLGWWCWLWPGRTSTVYYAIGSNELLGSKAAMKIILYTVDGQVFRRTDCTGGG